MEAAVTPDISAPVSVRGEVLDILHQDPANGFSVLLVRQDGAKETFRAVGRIERAVRHARVQLVGRWHDGPRGRELRITTARAEVNDPAALIGLIATRARIPVAEAEKIVERLGRETLETLDSDPRCVEAFPELEPATVEAIRSRWVRVIPQALAVRLAKVGLSGQNARALYAQYGDGLEAALKENPYLPCVRGFVPLSIGASLAKEFGNTQASPRLMAGIVEALKRAAREGNTLVEETEALSGAARATGLVASDVDSAREEAVGMLVREEIVRTGGGQLQLETYANAELSLVEWLRRRLASSHAAVSISASRLERLARARQLDASPATMATLSKLFSCSEAVVQALPSRDEHFIAFVVEVLRLMNQHVLVVTPDAHTAARLRSIEIEACSVAESTMRDTHADALLLCDTDRYSVTEIERLMKLLATPTVWFLGEARRQGGAAPGQVFRDLWAAEVLPKFTAPIAWAAPLESALQEVLRYAEPPAATRALDGPPVHVIEAKSHEIEEAVKVLACELLPAIGVNSPLDALFVSPLKRAANAVTVEQLNGWLKRAWFPEASGPFVEGMPVMLDRDVEGARRGERGVVSQVKGRMLTVELGGRHVAVPVNGATSAFAVTAHRAGAVRSRVAVCVLAKAHGAMLSRDLLYSSCLGATERVFFLGEREALAQALATTRPERRTTLFGQLLDTVL